MTPLIVLERGELLVWLAGMLLAGAITGALILWYLARTRPARRPRPSETLAVLANWPRLEGPRRPREEPMRITEEQLRLATTARCASPDDCPVCQAATKRGSQ